MPELPEVEVIRRGLAHWVLGQTVLSIAAGPRRLRRQSPPEDFTVWVAGRRILRLSRRGKYLLFHLERGATLLVHLGMTGWFEVAQPKRYRLALRTSRGAVFLEDPRRFGRVRLVSDPDVERLFGSLGSEPLETDFSLDGRLETRRAIKVALLDQRVVAGVGNIYASESLWRARIFPGRPANSLTAVERQHLARGIVAAATKLSTTNGTNAVTICEAPAQGVVRVINYICVYDSDAGAETVNIILDSDGTDSQQVQIALAATESAVWTPESSWQVVT